MVVRIKGESGRWLIIEDLGSFFYAAKIRRFGVIDEQQRIFDISEIVR